jgi:hypothetical protein
MSFFLSQSVIRTDFIPVIFDAPSQSNGIGRAEADRYTQLTPWSTAPKGVKIFYKPDYTSTDNGSWSQCFVGSIVTVEPDLPSFRVFAGYVTAAIKLQAILNRNVYIIPCGDGGTIMNDGGAFRSWHPTISGECYTVANARYLSQAIAKLRTDFPGRQIVIFRTAHEGETDASQGRTQAQFLTDVQTYETAARGFTGIMDNAPFIVTKINYLQTSGEDDINAAWQDLADADPKRVKIVDISDLPRKTDLTTTEKGGLSPSTGSDDEHTSYLAQIEKGFRIAEQIRAFYGWADVSLIPATTNTAFDPSTINAGHVRLQCTSSKVTLVADKYIISAATNDLSTGTFSSVTNLVTYKHNAGKGWLFFPLLNGASANLSRLQSSAAIGTTLFSHSYSYSSWVIPRDGNPPSVYTLYHDVQNTSNLNLSRTYALITTDGKINVVYAVGGTAVSATTASAVFSDNTVESPVHIAITFTSGDYIRIYVNGVIQTLDAGALGNISALTMANYVNATNSLAIGVQRTGASTYLNHFYGHMREVTIQPVVYSTTDIANLMLN